MAERLLMQEEVDALLSLNEQQATGSDAGETVPAKGPSTPSWEEISNEEKDALGEIGNISMGQAATSLSEILKLKVVITSPQVRVVTKDKLIAGFTVPYVVIRVRYIQGLEGTCLLVVKTNDAAVIADLMMGGDGQNPPKELGELELSAASEAMNQMMGAAATALAEIFKRTVAISPPDLFIFDKDKEGEKPGFDFTDPIVVISFKMAVEDLLDTEIIQVLEAKTAKEKAALLLENINLSDIEIKQETEDLTEGLTAPASVPEMRAEPLGSPAAVPPAQPATAPPAVDQTKLDLILDIPLKVTVVLGRTRRPIKEILSLAPGSIVELAALADEPVEVLVNGTLVARGEVVVVNENFGVQITNIITPQERLQYLADNSRRA